MKNLVIRKGTTRVYNNKTRRYNQAVMYAVIDAECHVIKWFNRLSEAKEFIKEVQ